MKPFAIEPRYVEVYFESNDVFHADSVWEGFGARIQSNPTGAEKHYADKLWREAWETKTIEAEQAFWDYVAPRIVEWNYVRRQPDGTTITYPPPAEDAQVIIREIDDVPLRIWLATAVTTAHRPDGLGKLIEAVKASPNDAGSTDSTTPTSIRRKSSPKPSASTSAA